MKYLSIKNIYKRLKSNSPTFFKRMRIVMVSMGALGTAIIVAKAESTYLNFIPDWIISILVTSGVLGTFLTSLPVENTTINNIK